ncbi:tyrosine-type recombinase/integrase [candidate division KSB1 bacterium]
MTKLKTVQIVQRGNCYALHFRNPEGRRRRLSVGNDYQQAQIMQLKFTSWLLEGKNPENEINKAVMEERSKSITVKDFYPIFIERHGKEQSDNMQECYKYAFKNISRFPVILNCGIGEIKKKMMLEYMYQRVELDGVSNSTVNKEAVFIKGMISRAVEWEYLNKNPLSGLKKFSEADKRIVQLTPHEAKTLIEMLRSPVDSIVELAIYTGFRKESILTMRIEHTRFFDIDPSDKFSPHGEADIIVKGKKKDVRKTFPLGEFAVEVLKREIGMRKHGYVFVNPMTRDKYVSIHKSFNRIVRSLGLTVNNTKLRFHDLRHVFATWLHNAGASLDELRHLMGHRDRSTTDEYATMEMSNAGRVLNLMPRIRKVDDNKKMASSL